jgi:hypothetical protein
MAPCQLRRRRRELLIAHHHAAGAVIVFCARDDLLDSGDADRLAVTFALNRHPLISEGGDQINAVITRCGGRVDFPAFVAEYLRHLRFGRHCAERQR